MPGVRFKCLGLGVYGLSAEGLAVWAVGIWGFPLGPWSVIMTKNYGSNFRV